MHKRGVQYHLDPLSKKEVEQPIKIPGNAFWNVFKRFGRDETLAALLDALVTNFISKFIFSPFILSFIGPLIEKIGFFPMHAKDAWDSYKASPKKHKQPFSFYFKKALRGGTKSLLQDLFIHDPIYIFLVYMGILYYPSLPIWLIAGTGYLIGIFMVSLLEISFTETAYFFFKKRMKRLGFTQESFLEARFLVSTRKRPSQVMSIITKRFRLPPARQVIYHDKYFHTNLRTYLGRMPKLRLRSVTNAVTNKISSVIQIIYTKAYEETSSTLEQHRYFPVKKERFTFYPKQTRLKDITSIKEKLVLAQLKRFLTKRDCYNITFARLVTHNQDISIHTDKIKSIKQFYIIEIKTNKNINLLKKIMRFIMVEFPVVQTTQEKSEFIKLY